MRALAIETKRLGRIYKPRKNNKDEAKERIALSDVTLTVPRGELFRLLGPNGAGKTMFRRCDLIARERGLIDRTTNY